MLGFCCLTLHLQGRYYDSAIITLGLQRQSLLKTFAPAVPRSGTTLWYIDKYTLRFISSFNLGDTLQFYLEYIENEAK